MIRWSYVLPRLVALAIALAAIWFGLDPLVRRTLIVLGEAAVLAKVEISEVRTSFRPMGLAIRDLRVANRFSASKNLIEAGEVSVSLDGKALRQRNLVVREGRISGLKINTDRSTSGELDWHLRLPGEALAKLSEAWLDQAAGLLKGQIEQEIEQLESVRLANELAVRWPADCRKLESRVDAIKARAERLQELLGARSHDLYQQIQAYQQAAAELEQLRTELAELRQAALRLPQQAAGDRDAVVRAANRDLERIRQRIDVTRLDAESISQYLLGPELADRMLVLARSIAWARRHFPAIERTEPIRSRGRDILFPVARRDPRFLVQSLALDGEVSINGHPLRFRGTAEGLTTEPRVYGRPAVIRAEVAHKSSVQVAAILDHTQTVPHERFVLHLPSMSMPERVLGQPDRLALAVGPGNMRVEIAVDLVGDDLSGQVLVRQEPVELVPRLASRYGGPRLAESLRASMSGIRAIELDVRLSGTVDRPQWQFQSNLGPQLVACLDSLVRREIEIRQAELADRVQRRIDAELAQLQETVLVKQDQLLGKLDLGGTEVQQLAQAVAQRLRVQAADKLLGQPLRF